MPSTSAKVLDEATIPTGYKYEWSKNSDITIVQFIEKYKPSEIYDDGSKPWIWVRCEDDAHTVDDMAKAIQRAEAIEQAGEKLSEVTESVLAVQNDASIPARANKKTGAKSKKETREAIQSEGKDALREIALERHFTCGNWLCYASQDSVDRIWGTIARSLTEGPLSKTAASIAKVSTSKTGQESSQHVICIYLPNIFDKGSATEVLKVLVGDHNIMPSGAKPDIYTLIGLDSKHSCGLRSTVWQPKELISESDLQALRDAHADRVKASKAKPVSASTKPASTKKAPPRRKAHDSDEEKNPFASDDENEEPVVAKTSAKAEEARRAALFKKTAGQAPRKRSGPAIGNEGKKRKAEAVVENEDDSDGSTEDEEEVPLPKRRKTASSDDTDRSV